MSAEIEGDSFLQQQQQQGGGSILPIKSELERRSFNTGPRASRTLPSDLRVCSLNSFLIFGTSDKYGRQLS